MSPVSRQKKQKGQQYVTTLETSDTKAAQIDLLYVGARDNSDRNQKRHCSAKAFFL